MHINRIRKLNNKKEETPKKKQITTHIRQKGQTRRTAKQRERKQNQRESNRHFISNGVRKTTCKKLKSKPNRAK